ncbi:DUF2388 domain-containing protein [Pseudomonas luteola]|uniref:DUF2388 domain-containing protein n=1 Tax=Pseudomonas luteola TaxID=47886 RepID=A0ABS0MVD7_PSELU|nr:MULTISPECIES: DUF2388 domain-containing protein [Pseudomonas]AYN92495.1 DUF2388 domain-containing protein [Pseudomonas sp. LTJR-52]MBH3440682.1 DUF2388 domain-containing protein [Pseudomonas luteola]
MRLKKFALVPLVLLPFAAGSAMADAKFWRHVATSGATTGSTYLSSRDDHKMVIATQDDASAFLASNGEIRGPYLEAALREMRNATPGSSVSDIDLATKILTAQQ